LLVLAEDRCDGADDAGACADFDPFSDLERLRMVEMTGRNDGVALSELVAVSGHQLFNGGAVTPDCP
jgi:hypothetical protein